MPIRIYRESEVGQTLAYLCPDDWELPSQLAALGDWARTEKARPPVRPPHHGLVADIGFSVREGATGGGGVLTADTMAQLAELGFDVYFSEYDDSSEGVQPEAGGDGPGEDE